VTAPEGNLPVETEDVRRSVLANEVCAAAVSLGAGDTLVLQDPDYDTPVFSLSLRCGIRSHLLTGAHCAWGQNVCQRNLTLLLQDIRHVLGAFTSQSGASPRARNLLSPRLRGPTGRRRFVEQVDQRFGSGHNRLRAFHNVLCAEVLAVESPVGVIIRIHRRPLD